MERCSYCNGNIITTELSKEAGLSYHNSCIAQKYAKRQAHLEQKIQNGTIKLVEMAEYKEIFQILENMNVQKEQVQPNKSLSFLSSPKEQLITRPKERESIIHSVLEDNFKRLEAAREKRWDDELKRLEEKQAQQKQIEGDTIGTM